MTLLRIVTVVSLGFSVGSPMEARAISDIRADGTWDCKDEAGANVGTMVIASERYAFETPDGKLGGYGDLHAIDQGGQVPQFAVLNGYIKDELGGLAIVTHGPKGHEEEYSGDIFLAIGLTPPDIIECAPRLAPRA